MTAPINARPGDTVMLDVPTDILCSFFYFRDIDMHAIAQWGTRIIGDSGAFSAATGGEPVDRDTFHEWASRWEDDLFWVAALDVIGDQAATRQNWAAAQKGGLNLVPTIHYGLPPETMDWYVDHGVDFLGLGGMVPYSSEPARLMRWLIPFFKRVRDNYPHVRFHGWGVSHPELVDNLPWWSTDSSGFSSAFRFGNLRLFDPRRGKFTQVDLNGRDIARHRVLLARYYGLPDWKLIAHSTPQSRREVGRVAIKAVQLYAHWLQARQAVTCPPSLAERLERSERGPAQVVAVNPTNDSQLFHPDYEGPGTTFPKAGPHIHVAPGSDLKPFSPSPLQTATGAPVAGPFQPLAMGSPAMQPVKALSPEDTGPMQAMTGGRPGSFLASMNPEDNAALTIQGDPS